MGRLAQGEDHLVGGRVLYLDHSNKRGGTQYNNNHLGLTQASSHRVDSHGRIAMEEECQRTMRHSTTQRIDKTNLKHHRLMPSPTGGQDLPQGQDPMACEDGHQHRNRSSTHGERREGKGQGARRRTSVEERFANPTRK